jgi:phenylacetate-CoA ligase
VSFSHLKPGCYWQENPIYNESAVFAVSHEQQTLPAYVEQSDSLLGRNTFMVIRRRSELLAEFIIRRGGRRFCRESRLLSSISEGFAGQQRERIEAAFQTRVFSFYCHSERIIMAGECEANETYHQSRLWCY